MRRLTTLALLATLLAAPSWALTSISAYKTFTREILTSDDLNQSFSTVISGVNNLIALHPGDSTKTTYGAFDSLIAAPGPNLVVLDPLTSKSADDSLNFHLANIERANLDTFFVGKPLSALQTAYTAGTSTNAGIKWALPYAQIDSLAVDSLTVAGNVSILAGATLDVERGDIDTVTTDCLTVVGPATFVGAVAQPAGQQSDLEYASIDTLNSDSLTVIGPATVTGAARLQLVERIEMRPDSARITMIDTTIAAMSAKKLRFVNLHSPVDVWFPDAVDSYARYRQIEQGTSLWRTDGIRHPAFAVARIATANDSTSIWDMTNWSETLVFKSAVDNSQMGPQDASDLVFKDGVYFISSDDGGAGQFEIDLLADGARRWRTDGLRVYTSNIAGRNSGVSWSGVMNASPAIVNNTVNAVAVTRSPWPFHLDAKGRRLPYWMVGTSGGLSVASYDADGTQSIFDSSNSTNAKTVAVTPLGDWIAAFSSGGWWFEASSIFAATGDGIAQDNAWTNSTSPPVMVSTGATANAVFPRGSATENRERYLIAGTSNQGGLVILDAADAGTSGACSRHITNTYVTPPMCGDIQVAFGGGSSANYAAPTVPFIETGSPAYTTSSAAGPGHGGYYTTATGTSLYSAGGSAYNMGTADWYSTIWWKSGELSGNGNFMVLSGTADQAIVTFRADLTDQLRVRITDDTWSSNDLLGGPTNLDNTGWVHVMFGRDGSNWKLWVNGVLSATTAVSNAAAAIDADTLWINDNTVRSGIGHVVGVDIGSISFTLETPTDALAASFYAEGLDYINSPTPDTLRTGGDVDFLATDRYSGSLFALGDEATVERRLPSGALIDTLKCSTCGTLAAVDVAYFAGQDSSQIIFGGSTGSRYVGPDPRVIDMGQHVNTWKDVTFGSPVVVDSAGHGDFWTFQDAIDAAANAGQQHVYGRRGTYPPFDIDHPYMQIEGESWLTVIDGGTTDDAIEIDGTHVGVVIKNLSVKTTALGGTGFDGINISSSGADSVQIIHVQCLESDDDCLFTDGDRGTLSHSTFRNPDDDGVVIGSGAAGQRWRIFDNAFTGSGGLDLSCSTTGDVPIITGNLFEGSVTLDAGCDNGLVDGNVVIGTLTDNGTGNTVGDNE